MSYEIDHQKLSEHIFSIIRKISVPAGLYVFLAFIIMGFSYLMAFTSIFGSIEEIAELTKDEAAFTALITENSIEMILLNAGISVFMHYLLSGIYGMIKKVNCYESFKEGVSSNFKILLDIFPNLLALVFAVEVFTSSLSQIK